MGKMELEVKILDIDKEEFIKKITKLGAEFKGEVNQFLYTYDLPTIYGRYIDILTQLNNPENNIKYETAIEKYKLFAFEIDNLLDKGSKQNFKKISGYNSFLELLDSKNIVTILNSKDMDEFIKDFKNNSKKWIRVRQTGEKTTIAVKHILADNGSNIQQMLETEIEVKSIEEANNLLESLGFSHKSYQEKSRITYELYDHEIDIDTWPKIPTYVEIEGTSKEDLDTFLQKIGYDIKNTVSCTADEIYQIYGLSMFDDRELKF